MKEDETELLKKIVEEGNTEIVMKKVVLGITLKDIYGGDGEIRYQQMKHKLLVREKSKNIKSSTMPGMDNVRKTTEIITEIVDEPINTFKEIDGKPVLNLGKKIKGIMKKIGINYARMKHPVFPSQAFVTDIMSMINVEPDVIIVANDKKWRNNGNYYLASSPQIFNKVGSPMITLHYDALHKINSEVIISYPSTFEQQVSAMIKLLPSVKTLNRKATTIVINSEKYDKK